MAKYDTAGAIIRAAAIECSLTNVPADPFTSPDEAMVQMCNLITQCGQELITAHQWEQLVRNATISTGASPPSDGQYDLPSDFNYMINQTGWTPANVGMGLPLGGPLSEQVWAAIVASNLASSTIYVSFKIAAGVLQFLPAPAPANIDITYSYLSRGWVAVAGDTSDLEDSVQQSSDVIMFDRLLMIKMLAARYKQQKGLPADSSLEQFTMQFAAITGIDTPAPLLYMGGQWGFPYLNVYTNVPQTNYGL